MKGELHFEGQNVGSSLIISWGFLLQRWFERDLGHYGKGVHRSKILGEWSNVINYDMGVSPTRIYTTTNTFFLGGELQGWMKRMIWLSSWQYFFVRGVSVEVKFLGQCQTL